MPRALPPMLLVSGAVALAYEVLWARDWALLYGSTATGTAVVLAAYFAGLAAGGALGARLAAARRGLALYAALEGGVAATILVYLALRPHLPAAAVALAAAAPATRGAARVLLAFAVLALPTTLLGATLPAAVAALPAPDAPAAGRLYAWNTLGGVLGALACGFVAVRALGVRGTFLAAAALEAAVAAVAFALARGTNGAAARAERAPTAGDAAPLAVALAALTGAVGLADEVLWTRGLAGVLSNSVYSIALVLAAVLLGLVGGAWLSARRADAPVPRARVAAAYATLALATLGSWAALHAVPSASGALVRAVGVATPGAGLAIEAALALLIVLAPALALGALFPLLLGLAGGAAARATGRLLAANTAGGIAGALGGAFVLLPRLGLGGGLLATAALPGVAALGLAPRGRRAALAAGTLALVALAALAAPPLRLGWQGRWGAERLLFYRDGPAATVMVTADARGGKRLRVNAQYSLGGSDGVLLERREAHLPLLLHPAPARLLALGVGTGDTLGAAVAHPGLTADGVEVLPEALAAAAYFEPENGGVLANPRARVVVDDARTFLLTATERWDVILSDLFLPWTAGTAYLYSRDFYRLGRAHLRPGGLYCQWLPLHQLAASDLEAVVATFVASFPEVQLWLAYHRAATPLAALVGSETPLRVDAHALAARLHDPALAPTLQAVGFYDPDDLGVLYVTDGAHLRAATAGVAPITDDRPRLEFTAPAAYFAPDAHRRGAALAWVAARLDPRPAPLDGEDAPGFPLRATLLRAQLALLAGDGPDELAAYLDAFALEPRLATVRNTLTAIAAERAAAGDLTVAARVTDLVAGTR